MKNNSKNDFEQIISYTIRIELTDGTMLRYYVSPEAKKAFRNQLLNDAVSIAPIYSTSPIIGF